MSYFSRKYSLTAAATLLLALSAACHKKTAPPPPTPPAPQASAAKPTINYFNAEPSTINSGQSSALRWSVSDSSNIKIDGIGTVQPDGSQSVSPTSTVTYHLMASNDAGSTDAEVTVAVSTPPAPEQTVQTPTESAAEILANQVKDLHFDYDKSSIRPEDQTILQSDASALRTIFVQDPNFVVQLEGNSDERGSAEYNLGLGDRRATATKNALMALGISPDKLKTISYGKERPLCTDAEEACYARNRRAHFAAAQ